MLFNVIQTTFNLYFLIFKVLFKLKVPSFLVDSVEKFMWQPEPFQSPKIGFGSMLNVHPNSSPTLFFFL